ncbi:hypothetical protein GUJ93_ZPchr0001g33108 [Zizania palustris]|uniref:LTI65/LTI78 PGEED repeat domain-containing protein n=1 Tax=Zizania palustris TaxID=103762 RepID=A0A8J5R7X7_ZIZPA|nr:hypothetical protein GUJ93_ZPchr0001g33108 [Zizania palustris]
MNEIRKLKRGISTKRGDHLAQNGQNPFDAWEEQQRYLPSPSPSPRAPPVSPLGSPWTPNGSQKKPVLGKVKSKAKKWINLLHHKKKPMPEDMMWTPRAGPSADDRSSRDEQHDADHGSPSTARHPYSFEPVRVPEVYMEASPRQNSPLPSPTAHKEQPYFKVSSRFESEMKEANEMLRESKQLRVNTNKQKTVTFAPILEQGPENVKNNWKGKELSETATGIFRNAYATVYEVALKMVSIIQDTMVSYNIDRRKMLEKIISFNRYLMLKLEPGEGDKVLSEVITEAVLDLLDAWCENVERPLVQRATEVYSWFLQEKREELHPVPLSTHPCAYEDEEEFYSLEN